MRDRCQPETDWEHDRELRRELDPRSHRRAVLANEPSPAIRRASRSGERIDPNRDPDPIQLDLDPAGPARLAAIIVKLAAAYRGPTLIDRIRVLLAAVAALAMPTDASGATTDRPRCRK